MVIKDRVDLRELDEVLDVDRLGLLGLQRVELAGLDHDVAVGRDLEAFDDLLVGDLLVALRVHALLRDAVVRLARELVEAHGLAVHGAVQLHRHRDQPEADRACPDGTGHVTSSTTSPLRACKIASGRDPACRNIDVDQHYIFVAENRHVEWRLLDRNRRRFDLGECGCHQGERA